MKTRFLLLFFFVLALLNVQAQQDTLKKTPSPLERAGERRTYNPFEKYGYTKEILTLSKGRYQEFFPNDTLQRIGSVIYNIHTKQIVKILPPDTLRIDPEVPARWWGVDPLAEKFPEQSPYNYVENNPIIKIDPDGRESEEVNCCGVLKRLAKTVYKSVVKGKVDLSEVYSTIDDGVTLLSPNSTLLERGEALFNLVSPIDTKEIKAVGKTLGIVSDVKDVGKKLDKAGDLWDKVDVKKLDKMVTFKGEGIGSGTHIKMNEDGFLTGLIKIQGEDMKNKGLGTKMFGEAIGHFGDKVKGIKGVWLGTDGIKDNFDAYAKAFKETGDVQKAAFSTPTGRIAAKLGYTKAIPDSRNTTGQIIFYFTK